MIYDTRFLHFVCFVFNFGEVLSDGVERFVEDRGSMISEYSSQYFYEDRWQAYLSSGALQKYWLEYSENMEPPSSTNLSTPSDRTSPKLKTTK
ncbi:hypothetical protein DPMN_128748 [Dreissena polymorpha]|uniref:Uncharacterized protein n=1 Tax=Dreissena polymorpha TaxID=45954 RepID=A0A9D4JWR4_DREPO|nr:hypothetical protein DPMN_128748 [Dreissena polymorpha]